MINNKLVNKRITCGPGQSALEAAKQFWGDNVKVCFWKSEEKKYENDDRYMFVGSVSVRQSQPDMKVYKKYD